MIQPERVLELNTKPRNENGAYVLYWMQQAQRTRYNHALETAIREANELGLPVLAVFGLTDSYPDANERHYAFMLEGLRDVREGLERHGIQLVVLRHSPEKAAVAMAQNAALVVTDRGYLRIQKQWRAFVAENVSCQMIQVESDAVVPVETASQKEEFAARTLRPKIHRVLANYLVPLEATMPEHSSLSLTLPTVPELADRLDVRDVDAVLASMKIDRAVGRVGYYIGGETEAQRLLQEFVSRRLKGYAEKKNEPKLDHTSHMSAYLHFGQISPLDIALQVRDADTGKPTKKPANTTVTEDETADAVIDTDADAYLEELIVRRELSFNFCHFNDVYDTYECLPNWAKQTLADKAADARPHLYTLEDLEAAHTNDRYWNAAQAEMNLTGRMHNYMRMYWGKKILEWSSTPEEGYRRTLYLNNKYFLCGRDANAFANVAWIYGKFDRPWTRRPVFGTIRYMNAGGLQRKFDIEAYVRKIAALPGAPPLE